MRGGIGRVAGTVGQAIAVWRDGLWARRLTAVGRALDDRGGGVADLAILFADDRVQVTGLEWHGRHLRSGWQPFDLSVDLGASGACPRPSSWAAWLRAVGELLDREPAPLRDVCLLQVPGGLVVQALEPEPDGDRLAWRRRSREFTTATIEAAANRTGAGRGAH